MKEQNINDHWQSDLPDSTVGDCELTVVSDPAVFPELRDQWDELLSGSAQNSVFLSWAWLYSWWEVFGAAHFQLRILMISRQGRLIGLAPLQIHRMGWLDGRVLRFIGTGEPAAHEVVSEYLDLIAAAGQEQQVIACVKHWIENNAQSFRRVQFDDVLQTSLCQQLIDALNRPALSLSRTSGLSYFVPLESERAYRETLSNSRRKRLKRCENALVKDGGGLHCRSLTAESDIEESFGVLQALNSERWSDRTGKGVFESRYFLDFHRKVAARLLTARKVALELFYLDGKPLAALYLFRSREALHYYQSGFVSENANRYMPLFVAHVAMIERAASEGLERYDFMRGAASSYKSDYGCQTEPMLRLMFFRQRWQRIGYQMYTGGRRWLADRARQLLTRLKNRR